MENDLNPFTFLKKDPRINFKKIKATKGIIPFTFRMKMYSIVCVTVSYLC